MRVEFIPPDTGWTTIGSFVSRNHRFGAIAMVKWRSFGVGVEWFQFNWLALFVGPLCVSFGRVRPNAAGGDHAG